MLAKLLQLVPTQRISASEADKPQQSVSFLDFMTTKVELFLKDFFGEMLAFFGQTGFLIFLVFLSFQVEQYRNKLAKCLHPGLLSVKKMVILSRYSILGTHILVEIFEGTGILRPGGHRSNHIPSMYGIFTYVWVFLMVKYGTWYM